MESPKDNNLRLLALAVHQIFDKFHDHYIIVEIKSDKCGVNSTNTLSRQNLLSHCPMV